MKRLPIKLYHTCCQRWSVMELQSEYWKGCETCTFWFIMMYFKSPSLQHCIDKVLMVEVFGGNSDSLNKSLDINRWTHFSSNLVAKIALNPRIAASFFLGIFLSEFKRWEFDPFLKSQPEPTSKHQIAFQMLSWVVLYRYGLTFLLLEQDWKLMSYISCFFSNSLICNLIFMFYDFSVYFMKWPHFLHKHPHWQWLQFN